MLCRMIRSFLFDGKHWEQIHWDAVVYKDPLSLPRLILLFISSIHIDSINIYTSEIKLHLVSIVHHKIYQIYNSIFIPQSIFTLQSATLTMPESITKAVKGLLSKDNKDDSKSSSSASTKTTTDDGASMYTTTSTADSTAAEKQASSATSTREQEKQKRKEEYEALKKRGGTTFGGGMTYSG